MTKMLQFSPLTIDVVSLLVERGSLSKEEIDASFSPSADDYRRLRHEMLQMPNVTSGPQRTGGFRLKRPSTVDLEVPAEDPAKDRALLQPWERQAVVRLDEILTYADLETLLGQKLLWTLRAECPGQRPSKQQLLEALVIKHGTELLQDTAIRACIHERVTEQSNKDASLPGRWHSGKKAADAFVAAVGLPPELVGVPGDERSADYEVLEGRPELRPLEDFQKEVLCKARHVVETPGDRALITLPTGAGKTRVAVEAIREWLTERGGEVADGRVVLWLAHTEELCEQAYTCFKEIWEAALGVPSLYLFRFWGHYTKDLIAYREVMQRATMTAGVFVSTPQRVANLIKGASDGGAEAIDVLAKAVRVMVVDEAHRAAAPIYSMILNHFHTSEPAVLGLTATPFRMEYAPDGAAETRQLSEIFGGRIIEPSDTLGSDSRVTLQRMGVLARPLIHSIRTGTRLEAPTAAAMDDPDDEDVERIDTKLKSDADKASRRRLIVEQIARICKDSNNMILYFGPSVVDADMMTFMLRQRRIPSACVSGETREATRRQVISQFRKGNIRVLCNCEVLTTGFDAPRVTHIVVARPTVSQVLYEQMVGRGLRGPKFGGTEHCVIVNCEDDYRSQTPRLGYVGWREIWKPDIVPEAR
jgi:superfamily II DNA or RNA helicase